MCLRVAGQPGNLFGREVTPGAGRQPGEPDSADADARQPHNGVADGRHHPPDLPVAALKNGEFDLGLRVGGRLRWGREGWDVIPPPSPRGPQRLLRLEHPSQADVLGRRRRSVFK